MDIVTLKVKDMSNKVIATIRRDVVGTHRVFCKRAKYKHWHELGRHHETDVAFAQALKVGLVKWETAIVDNSTLF